VASWVLHRLTGLVLAVLVPLRLYCAFAQEQRVPGESILSSFPACTTVLDRLLIFFFLFHAAYGVRLILLDLGVKWERILFWAATFLAAASYCGAYWYLFLR